MNELPMIAKSAYVSSTYNPDEGLVGALAGFDPKRHDMADNARRVEAILGGIQANHQQRIPQVTTRIVRVFIVDPNENIPLDKRVIYKSEEKLTDMTDQELFFDANPAALLAEHNQYRTTVVDKKLAAMQGMDRGSVMLPAARIRDLKMIVVDVAAF